MHISFDDLMGRLGLLVRLHAPWRFTGEPGANTDAEATGRRPEERWLIDLPPSSQPGSGNFWRHGDMKNDEPWRYWW